MCCGGSDLDVVFLEVEAQYPLGVDLSAYRTGLRVPESENTVHHNLTEEEHRIQQNYVDTSPQ